MNKKKNFIISIASFFIFLSLVLSVNYAVQRRAVRMEIPYNLTSNYETLNNKEGKKVSFFEVIDVYESYNITVISEYLEDGIIGLYDPRMYFYSEINYAILDENRYFSYEDYINKVDVGIKIENNENDSIFSSSNYINEELFSIYEGADLFKEGYTKVINLTSLNTLGDVIFIDADDLNSVKDFTDKLIEFGYEIVEKEEITLVSSIILSLKSHIYESAVLVSSLSLYILFSITSYYYFYSLRKIIKINQLNGGSIIRTFIYLNGKFLKLNILLSVCVFFIFQIYTNSGFIETFNINHFNQLFIFHILVTTFLFFIGYSINFLKVENEGGQIYVK